MGSIAVVVIVTAAATSVTVIILIIAEVAVGLAITTSSRGVSKWGTVVAPG